MKLSKMILMTALVVLSVAGADNAAIVQAIKANPALLDSPEAKKMMETQNKSLNESIKTKQAEPINVVDNNVSSASLTPNEDKALDEAFEHKQAQEHMKWLVASPLATEKDEDYQKRLLAMQIRSEQKAKPLQRYGIEFFSNKNGLDLASLPVPENYKIVPKDELSVILYGPKSDNMSLTVDKDGMVVIPSFGPLHIAGLNFSEAKKTIADALMAAYPNVGVTVNITQFSSIQVTLAGEVVTPGLYNVSSFATIKEALIAAGGLSERGSMREVLIKRKGKIVAKVDLYTIIRGTAKGSDLLLKAGDVIVVPLMGKNITIDGDVKRPAVYEALNETTISDLIRYAGGLNAEASKNDIKISRFEQNQGVKVLNLSMSEAAKTVAMDQDSVYVHSLDKSNLQGISLYGNVVKPGYWPLPKEGIELKDFFKKEIELNTLRGVFLEQTYFDYAIIKRMNRNLKEELIGFSLKRALNGEEKVRFQNRDELYILNQTMVSEKPIVKISGECVSRPGEYKYFEKMTLEALLGTAGTKCLIDRKKVTIVSRDSQTNAHVIQTVDMSQNPNQALNVFDEVKVLGFYTTNPIKNVTINGEVHVPGAYPIDGEGTTLRKLIEVAGGITDKAAYEKVELVRYSVDKGVRKRQVKVYTLSEVMGEHSPVLQNYDEVTIFKIPKWNERKTIKLYGNINYPGEYPIENGETLSDVLKRAGGFTDNAYLEGAVFTRDELKERQREAMDRQIKELEQRILYMATQPTEAGQNSADKTQLVNLLASLKEEIQKTKFVGRLSLRLSGDLNRFKGSSSDILLKNGDALYVPEREDSVMVQGQVLNPNTVIYNSELILSDYLEKAGGLKESADSRNIFIVHANGEAEGYKSSYLLGGSTSIGPGDVIVVPMYISTYSGIQLAKDITAILYQLAVSVAALDTIGAL